MIREFVNEKRDFRMSGCVSGGEERGRRRGRVREGGLEGSKE